MPVSESTLVRASSGSPQRTVEELSEEIGWAWYQWRLFIFVGLCVAADAIEVNLLSYVSVETTKDWQLEEFGEDTISAAVFGGQAVGCAIFGTFADRYGRLPAFLTGVAFVSVFGAASSLTANLTQLIAMRFGVGVESEVSLCRSTSSRNLVQVHSEVLCCVLFGSSGPLEA